MIFPIPLQSKKEQEIIMRLNHRLEGVLNRGNNDNHTVITMMTMYKVYCNAQGNKRACRWSCNNDDYFDQFNRSHQCSLVERRWGKTLKKNSIKYWFKLLKCIRKKDEECSLLRIDVLFLWKESSIFLHNIKFACIPTLLIIETVISKSPYCPEDDQWSLLSLLIWKSATISYILTKNDMIINF